MGNKTPGSLSVKVDSNCLCCLKSRETIIRGPFEIEDGDLFIARGTTYVAKYKGGRGARKYTLVAVPQDLDPQSA